MATCQHVDAADALPWGPRHGKSIQTSGMCVYSMPCTLSYLSHAQHQGHAVSHCRLLHMLRNSAYACATCVSRCRCRVHPTRNTGALEDAEAEFATRVRMHARYHSRLQHSTTRTVRKLLLDICSPWVRVAKLM